MPSRAFQLVRWRQGVREWCVGSEYNKTLFSIRTDSKILMWDASGLNYCHLPVRAPEPTVPTIFASRTAGGRKVPELGCADIF